MAEEMKEGTSFFLVRALLPVVESFGFADGTFGTMNITRVLFLILHQTYENGHPAQLALSLSSAGETTYLLYSWACDLTR